VKTTPANRREESRRSASRTTAAPREQRSVQTKYVAFLRGINVGGHKQIKMADLRTAFESLGFENVKTLLNSGNVLFETAEKDPKALVPRIEATLKSTFGHDVGVILRTAVEIQALVDSNPFKNVNVTPETRLYATFLSEKPNTSLKIPNISPDGNFKILRVSAGEVCSVLVLLPGSRTVDAMSVLEKEFGRKVTTRNWNTVKKLV